jgi:hypothetical protein
MTTHRDIHHLCDAYLLLQRSVRELGDLSDVLGAERVRELQDKVEAAGSGILAQLNHLIGEETP